MIMIQETRSYRKQSTNQKLKMPKPTPAVCFHRKKKREIMKRRTWSRKEGSHEPIMFVECLKNLS